MENPTAIRNERFEYHRLESFRLGILERRQMLSLLSSTATITLAPTCSPVDHKHCDWSIFMSSGFSGLCRPPCKATTSSTNCLMKTLTSPCGSGITMASVLTPASPLALLTSHLLGHEKGLTARPVLPFHLKMYPGQRPCQPEAPPSLLVLLDFDRNLKNYRRSVLRYPIPR